MFFRFEPIFKRYLWGGHRLRDVLGKPTGDETCAESWELVDHRDGQSVVIAGEYHGSTLGELVSRDPVAILGEDLARRVFDEGQPAEVKGRFPLLLKYLDAKRDLSVQVHPDDVMGATLSPPDLGKTEAWYVMAAEPGAKIYAGLKEGVSQQEFRAAVQEGTVDTCLHSFHPKPGDCVFIQAGTVHAIGAGLLVAEIQQASNTTFRIYDWNRVDQDGKPRELHIEQGIEAIDFQLGPVQPTTLSSSESDGCLVKCDKFNLHQRSAAKGAQWVTEGGRMRIVTVLSGALNNDQDPVGKPVCAGQTALIPACCPTLQWEVPEDAEFLEIVVDA